MFVLKLSGIQKLLVISNNVNLLNGPNSKCTTNFYKSVTVFELAA